MRPVGWSWAGFFRPEITEVFFTPARKMLWSTAAHARESQSEASGSCVRDPVLCRADLRPPVCDLLAYYHLTEPLGRKSNGGLKINLWRPTMQLSFLFSSIFNSTDFIFQSLDFGLFTFCK
jgi:hypothetical protein